MGNKKENTEIVRHPKNIADKVLARVTDMESRGEITLPAGYNAGNALKSAYLILKQTVDKNKKPVLQSCTEESIANALLDMVVQGLNPGARQCYFIAYGTKLQLQRSYFGDVAVARRVAGLKDIYAEVVREGEVFEYVIDPAAGKKKIIEHKVSLSTADNPIIGAYAVAIFDDGSSDVEIMTKKQIDQSWSQSKNKGSDIFKKFPEEMAKRTVIRRLLKTYVNSAIDINPMLAESYNRTTEDEYIKDPIEVAENEVAEELPVESASEEVSFEESAEDAKKEKPEPEETEEQPTFLDDM